MAPPRSIALIDPIGDAGIGGYTHELAQGLVSNGIAVDVYARRDTFACDIERSYCLHGVFAPRGHRSVAGSSSVRPDAHVEGAVLDPYFDLLERRGSAAGRVVIAPPPLQPLPHLPAARHTEGAWRADTNLAACLAQRRPDVVWSQWPDVGDGEVALGAMCRSIGVPLVHTVHNVVPHEPDPDGMAQHEAIYRDAAALVVHSEMAAEMLATAFPETRNRIVRSWHGAYTMFPRRREVRDRIRARLDVGANDTVVLAFGGVRPYKNIDVVLDAMRDPRCDGVTLVVAGWEWGYPDGIPGDRLGRTRARSWRLGVGGRVRLLPGPFGLAQTAELFEASDAAILPYTGGSGSGVLLLAMTFGTHVLATSAGGMHEYLDAYGNGTALASPSLGDVVDGLGHLSRRGARASTSDVLSERFAWPTIAREALVAIGDRLG